MPVERNIGVTRSHTNKQFIPLALVLNFFTTNVVKKFAHYDKCRIFVPVNAIRYTTMEEKTYRPSEAEWQILQIVWDQEPVSVRDIYEQISTTKEVGYTTVLKQVQRLTEKGILEKIQEQGGHLYRSTAQENEVKRNMAAQVLQNTFGGSALQMMMHALGEKEKMDPKELQALRDWLDKMDD
jgi:BlaI family transcriptional regulator, penicillinase repressor